MKYPLCLKNKGGQRVTIMGELTIPGKPGFWSLQGDHYDPAGKLYHYGKVNGVWTHYIPESGSGRRDLACCAWCEET